MRLSRGARYPTAFAALICLAWSGSIGPEAHLEIVGAREWIHVHHPSEDLWMEIARRRLAIGLRGDGAVEAEALVREVAEAHAIARASVPSAATIGRGRDVGTRVALNVAREDVLLADSRGQADVGVRVPSRDAERDYLVELFGRVARGRRV